MNRDTIRLIGGGLIAGLLTGTGGLLLVLLLHSIQHWAFGYSLGHLLGHESFLQGVSQTSPYYILFALSLCGLIAGLGWWGLKRFSQPIVTIQQALAQNGRSMPNLTTLCHVLLQITTVALGSPLGREAAPRELGALFAGWINRFNKLTAEDYRLLIASSAGAGLAAVYNVPLGGALFAIEVLLKKFSWRILAITLMTSLIASNIVNLVLGRYAQYQLPSMHFNWLLLIFAFPCGLLIGWLARFFAQMTKYARSNVTYSPQNILLCFINFFIIGLLALYLPALLGNGKAIVQLAFDNQLTFVTASLLLLFKMVIVLTSLRSGAYGGLLTPSLALGALVGVLLGLTWNYFFTPQLIAACSIIGAATFLAICQKMPITAIILMFEFTHINYLFVLPVIIAIAIATLTAKLTTKKELILT